MLYIGIDSGAKGAIAAVNEKGECVFLEDMPRDLDGQVLAITQELVSESNKTALEKVWGRPGQGAKQTFVQGSNYRTAELIAQSCDPDFELVPALTWQREFALVFPKTLGLTQTEKKHRHINKARELFPEVVKKLLVSYDGRADALLIAEWLRRQNKDTDEA